MNRNIHRTEAKAILFLLTNQKLLAAEVIQQFEPVLGRVNLQSEWHAFPKGHYYEEEMGKNLERQLISFQNLWEPHQLTNLKQQTMLLEEKLSLNGKRTINIDAGYVDLHKIVLASIKGGGQKVALAPNIFAHPLLRFEKGEWITYPWTFPDFKSPQYHRDLLKIREGLKKDLADCL